jgi:hypothetical protein
MLLSLLIATSAQADPTTILSMLKDDQPDGPTKVKFSEVRHYHLKKREFRFSGVMRLHPDLGMSIEYREPHPKFFILSESGLIIREKGKADEKAPEQAVPVVKVFLDLLALDGQSLEAAFKTEQQLEEAGSWTLTMFPKIDELKRAIQWIEIKGVEGRLESIRVQNGSRRWRIFEFKTVPTSWSPTESELKAYF